MLYILTKIKLIRNIIVSYPHPINCSHLVMGVFIEAKTINRYTTSLSWYSYTKPCRFYGKLSDKARKIGALNIGSKAN